MQIKSMFFLIFVSVKHLMKNDMNLFKSIVFVLVIIISREASAQISFYEYLDKGTIKGGYTKCESYSYNIINGVADSASKKLFSLRKFYEDGTISLGEKYLVNGSCYERVVRTLNEQNKVKEISYYGINLVPSRKNEYYYEEDSFYVKTYFFTELEIALLDKIYLYNNKALLTEYQEYDKDGQLVGTTYCKYNKKDRMIEEYGNSKTEGQFIYKYSYNKQGDIVETNISRDSIPYKVKNIWIYKYDKNGRKLEEISKMEDGYNFTSKYSYDKKGNLIEVIDISEDESAKKKTFKHDEFGNVTEVTEYDADFNPVGLLIRIYTK